ncbi:raffinose/stachyose/melibiose transport system substrate-binding protein [Paenibacillus shirakamiensis]|uniref:Raffinose/stachyose/melibiose transport system substrate-binding protein n=1 Tax=Paenibacillus shirakamiensis TaxID=1265935 RepID=A0ABS4JE99_9BACL|nr:extracellular solute-binding protein [Paenibacillus shirakamiensis]MBP2000023.1 raffinose/stachyose/melibiose transport system substrate-binding protein [Paenibacillus shirakamiensis]
MHMTSRYHKNTLVAISTLMVAMLAACSSGGSTKAGSESSDKDAKMVTLRLFTNQPDRKTGQGLAEQMVVDNYMKENPNIKIEVEAIGDEPFRNKQKAYMASNEPIDITMVHSGADLNTLVQAKYVRELDPKEYEGDNYKFFSGAFKSYTFDNKIYGLPRNSDYEVIYYNKKLFTDNHVKVPTTFNELIEAAKTFRANNIVPMSTNGKELWTFGLMYQDFAQRVSGDPNAILDAVDHKKPFTQDPSFMKTAELMKQLMDVKMFQDSYMTADYGTSQNLFTQGKAAMWYMGSWEAGMASNEKLSAEFRSNLGVMSVPRVEDGKGKATDLLAWNGGGYALTTSSNHPEEAKKFFDYMMRADQWAKAAWDTGAAVPAQKYQLTGKESEVQKQLTDILMNGTSMPGASFIDFGTPGFKDEAQNALGKFFAGSSTPEQLINEFQAAADKQKH